MDQHSPHTIAAVDTFVVRYPIVGRFRFFQAAAAGPITRDTVLVKITDDQGEVGWGQAVPSSTWSYETLESVRSTIEHYLAPAVRGRDVFDVDAIWRAMNQVIAASFSTGQPIAKSGIDLALFDLTGRIQRQTAGERWGRSAGKPVRLSWTVDAQSLADVAEEVAAARARGYRNFNLKVGRDEQFDAAVCRELRRCAGEAFLWADANGGYDLPAATRMARQMADLGFAAFEQPLPANKLPDYRRLRALGAVPIVMDEAIITVTDLESFHQLGLLDGVAMKVARCGGLTPARQIVEYVQQHGLHFFASGLTDPDLSLAAHLLLYSAYDLPHPAALNGPQFLAGSVLREPLRMEGDLAYPPSGLGLGVVVDETALSSADHTLEMAAGEGRLPVQNGSCSGVADATG